MPNPLRYLTVDEVVDLHDRALDECGDNMSPLLRLGTLESVLNRPAALSFYEGADIARQVAALAIGISQAQAFMDGNKRAALAAFDVFLMLNGHEYHGDEMELAHRLGSAAIPGSDRNVCENDFAEWLRSRLGPCVDEDEG